MPKTLKDTLQEVLDELGKEDFERFKVKLNNLTQVPLGCNKIPKGKLEEANRMAVCDLIINYYTNSWALDVTKNVLQGINQNDLAAKLQNVVCF
ncbi:apoptosis-associated speck-like protein containing a CARD [Pelodiscus sinensis]|uniref:apoptosis-associated speck-like protein containing a CARD n=1 Tax=Pelodiscus sinensis TaxID=13735 RepID=UPI003F6B15EF